MWPFALSLALAAPPAAPERAHGPASNEAFVARIETLSERVKPSLTP